VEIDKVRIGQVLRNLLNNSIKFTPKGTISIDTHVYHDKNKIQVKISDTGLGIPEEILPNIFGKFVTKGIKNEQSGTGLGLFLCKGIIEAHNGMIIAKNNFDEGASFEFTIPISQKNLVLNSSEISIRKRK
jgi:signal transduction histidine kinase